MLTKIRTFLSEVQAELKKVTWPTREELMGSTGVVFVTMAILATFIGVCDMFFSVTLSHILR